MENGTHDAGNQANSRRGIRIIDDNEDGAFFYGAGVFQPSSEGGVSHTPSNDFGPSLPTKAGNTQARDVPVAQIPPKKTGWAAVAKANIPEHASSGVSAPAGMAEPSHTIRSGPAAAVLCMFFMSGFCRFGDRCKFSHAKAEATAVEYFLGRIRELIAEDRSRREASSAARGLPQEGAGAGAGVGVGVGAGIGAQAGSNAGSAGARSKAQVAEEEASFTSDSFAWQAAAGMLRTSMLESAVSLGVCGSTEEAGVALHMAERASSAEVECGICLEHVTDAPGRKFGLLTSCTHAFCLDCIRAWRGRIDLPSETTRACPLCRQISYFVIPSDRFIADTGRKAEVNAAYQSSTKSIPCKHWDLGRGVCPFGSSCFYSHRMLDGSEHVDSGRHAFLMDAEGKIMGAKQAYQLSQFL